MPLPARLEPTSLFGKVQPVSLTVDEEVCEVLCRSCALKSLGHLCKACRSPVCMRCEINDMCPACSYGIDVPLEDDGCEAIQAQFWRVLRSGQQMQVSAGKRAARTLAQHHLRPQVVKQSLSCNAARALHDIFAQTVRVSAPESYLFEYCCEPDSVLSSKYAAHGGKIFRLGLPRFDLSRPSVVSSVVVTIQHLVNERWSLCVCMVLFALHCMEPLATH